MGSPCNVRDGRREKRGEREGGGRREKRGEREGVYERNEGGGREEGGCV